jgi:hypothetical protein
MYRAQGASPTAALARSYTHCAARHLLVSIKVDVQGLPKARRDIVNTGGGHTFTGRTHVATPTTLVALALARHL